MNLVLDHLLLRDDFPPLQIGRIGVWQRDVATELEFATRLAERAIAQS